MSVVRSVVTGVGAYLPSKVVTNDDLAKFVDTSDEWIVERTGIRQRHQAADDQPVSDLAVEAAKEALAAAGKTAADVDLIIVATTTVDLTFPATAAIVQRKLGAPVGVAFDLSSSSGKRERNSRISITLFSKQTQSCSDPLVSSENR